MEEEKAILQKLSRGDVDAFRAVYLWYAPRVESFAMKMLKNIHEAQDVAQNVFAKIWLQRESLVHVQSLNAWLFRMTRNAVIDVCKHRRVLVDYENYSRDRAEIARDDLSERVDTDCLAERVCAALDKMPDRRSEVYRLSRERGLSNREIAETLHISLKSVENHLTRALSSIKKEIS